MTQKTSSRFDYVDAIRGLAAFGVIYFHAGLEFFWDGYPLGRIEHALFWSTTQLTDLGKISVVLFFMVSGFVVPFSLLRPGTTPRDFVIGRAFRLYPAYWASIAVSLVVVTLLHQPSFSKFAVLANVAMIQSFIGQPNIQGLFWTLQIELVFYAICLVMFMLGQLQRLRSIVTAATLALFLAALLAVGRHVTGRSLPIALPLSLSVMFFGLVWRRRIIDGEAEAGRAARLMLVAFAFVFPGLAILGYGTEGASPPAWLRYTLTYYVAAALFVLLTTRLRLRWRVTTYLGRISYSVYLFGATCQVVLERLFPVFIMPGVAAHWLIGMTFAMTTITASIVYYVIEEPAVQAGRRLVKWLDGRRAALSITEVI